MNLHQSVMNTSNRGHKYTIVNRDTYYLVINRFTEELVATLQDKNELEFFCKINSIIL